MAYRVLGPESGGNRALLRTVRYWYDQYGLARHIAVKDAGYDTYRDLSLSYTASGQLWMAAELEWTAATWSPNEQQMTLLPAWEFRYDAPRQRYLKRLLEYDDFVGAYVPSATEPDVWTDYLGDQPYVDYDVTDSGGTPTAGELQRYLAALGVHAERDVVAQGTPETYYHPDLTGSTTLTTDETGAQSARTAYTAFGELVDSNGAVGYDPTVAPPTRYQYDGAYGYESGLIVLYGANPNLPPITLQHVGARWYQPGIGRFVQRDPIGIVGGINVYHYADGDPLFYTDPTGLATWATSGPWWAKVILNTTGGQQHIPVVDYGTAHNATVIASTAVSVIAPTGVCIRVVTMGGKALRATKDSWSVVKWLTRMRKYVRLDRPHHGKGWHWDGHWVK